MVRSGFVIHIIIHIMTDDRARSPSATFRIIIFHLRLPRQNNIALSTYNTYILF